MSVAELEFHQTPEYKAWASRVKKRARWRCEWCGLTAEQLRKLRGELHAAHIKSHIEWPQFALDDDNGLALCTFKDRRHRHPQGIGHGFGCHNSLSGHWGNAATMGPQKRRLAKRHKLLNVVLGMPLWTLLVIANAQLRSFAFLRPVTLGLPVSGRDFLTAAGILVGLYLGCVGGVDFALRHRFLSRGARGMWHGLMRPVRRIHQAKEPQHQG